MDDYLETLKEDSRVLYIYYLPYSLYGIDNDKYYYYVITKENFKDDHDNFIFIDINDWFNLVLQGSLEAWKCACLNRKYIIKEYVKLLVKTDPLKLRKIIDNKKSLISEDKDSLINIIIDIKLANQIIDNHKIVNYCVAKDEYYNIMKSDNYLDIFREYFNKYYKELCSKTDEILKSEKIKNHLNGAK